MCDQVVRPLLGRGAGGRSPGYRLKRTDAPGRAGTQRGVVSHASLSPVSLSSPCWIRPRVPRATGPSGLERGSRSARVATSERRSTIWPSRLYHPASLRGWLNFSFGPSMEPLSCAWWLKVRICIDERPTPGSATPGNVKLYCHPGRTGGLPGLLASLSRIQDECRAARRVQGDALQSQIRNGSRCWRPVGVSKRRLRSIRSCPPSPIDLGHHGPPNPDQRRWFNTFLTPAKQYIVRSTPSDFSCPEAAPERSIKAWRVPSRRLRE
jgi:hypothetical protein